MSEPGRFAPAVCLAFAVFALAGCGYPGEPLPPALNRPNRVVDLSAVERGEKIVIHVTLPAKTTEGRPVKQNPDLELRLGPIAPAGFRLPDWERGSERVPDSSVHLDSLSVSAEIPASKYYGQTLAVGVRVLEVGDDVLEWVVELAKR